MNSMRLDELLAGLADEQAMLNVTGLSHDSRACQRGDLFFACSGTRFHGRDFIEPAVAAGACAVVIAQAEWSPELAQACAVPLIGVEDIKASMGEAAHRFYGKPSSELLVIGITGTNGKTSCSHFAAQGLGAVGIKAAVVGTAGNGFPGALKAATHTTPDSLGVHRLLAELKAEGAEAVVMEVSSHALEQGRIAGVELDLAAFTNLSRDHLDYHGSMQAYGAAKARLFSHPGTKAGVINLDDAFGAELAQQLEQQADIELVGFGQQQGDVRILEVEQSMQGTQVALQTPWGEVHAANSLLGEFNLSNLLLTASLLGLVGLNPAQLGFALSALSSVSGRMECIGGAQGEPLLVVDYAHTPDALEKALQALKPHCDGQLWCVFGCGGDRDTGKRAEMGAVVAQLADQLVVTSDNPRTEAPEQIIDMIVQGIPTDQRNYQIIEARAAAIEYAAGAAQPGDIVLIAGKGHEDYQEINGVRTPFSDQAVGREALSARGQA